MDYEKLTIEELLTLSEKNLAEITAGIEELKIQLGIN